MAIPFNPPNPYGSYFNFGGAYGGDPTPSAWRAQNYPNLGAPLSQGTAAAMGTPSGGMNPTQAEFDNSRSRDIAFQQFIDRAIKDDPRTRTMGNMLLDGVYGTDNRAKAAAMARVGGADAYNAMIGTAMNLPGLSGYFGGSARSLAVGSLAVATSGLTMNGYGIFGDKSMNLRFADELMKKVNDRFYSSNGNPILSMTNGLNRDQLGGVMVQAASQGAFSGLDMGTFQKLDKAGNNVRFVANDSSVNKITEFMKQATKALGNMIDVYGNLSSGELMQKAQQITGMDLSRLENAGVINTRLQRLRDTAKVTGVDVQSVMDLSARAVDYGNAIGLRPEIAGTIGGYAANQGMRDYRARQINTSSFYTHTVSPLEMAQGITRDQAAMNQDPLGARFSALEMLIKNNNVSDTEAASLREKAAGFSANAAGVAGMDSLIQRRFGMSASGLIRGMGGPAALQQQLDSNQQQNLIEMNAGNLYTRKSNRIKQNLYRGGLMPMGTSADQLNAMHDLATGLDNETIEKVLAAKSDDDVAGIINPILGTDTGSLLHSASVIRQMGERGVAAYKNVRSSIQSDPLTQGFITREGKARNQWMNTPEIDNGFRGQLNGGGFLAGMIDRYTGNDPQSKLAWLAGLRPRVVAGVGVGENITGDFASMIKKDGTLDLDAWRKGAAGWRRGLEKTAEGKALSDSLGLQYVLSEGTIGSFERGKLEDSYNKLRDVSWRQKNMSGFDFFSINGGKNVAFARKSDMALKEKYGGDINSLIALRDELVKKGDESTVVAGLNQKIAMLSTGGGIFGTNPDGTPSDRLISRDPAKYMATKQDMDRVHGDTVRDIMDRVKSGVKFSDKALKAWSSDDAMSSDIIHQIDIQEKALRSVVDPNKRKENEKLIAKYEALRAGLGSKAAKGSYGDAAGPAGAAGNLTGELKLVDDGNGIVAKLQKVMLTQKGSN